MRAGIIGLPLVGKTTLFNMLTHAHAETTPFGARRSEPHVGVVRVPDARLEYLASIYKPRKTTFVTLEFVDVQGIVPDKGKEMLLAPLRAVDALVHVVRAFQNDSIPHQDGAVDPERDIRNVDAELVLADMSSTEKRMERLETDLKKVKDPGLAREQEFLRAAHGWLESGRPLREMEMRDDHRRIAKGFAFLSEKPMIYVWNVGEEDIERLKNQGGTVRPGAATTAICGELEEEMAELPPDELREFLTTYGLNEPGSERLIRATYRLLSLITFFTVGENECRSTAIPIGTTAHRAAGAIHTDMESHFIRAEVVHFDDFKAHGTMNAVREKGLLHLEGKEYSVQDGDIINFRHSG